MHTHTIKEHRATSVAWDPALSPSTVRPLPLNIHSRASHHLGPRKMLLHILGVTSLNQKDTVSETIKTCALRCSWHRRWALLWSVGRTERWKHWGKRRDKLTYQTLPLRQQECTRSSVCQQWQACIFLLLCGSRGTHRLAQYLLQL